MIVIMLDVERIAGYKYRQQVNESFHKFDDIKNYCYIRKMLINKLCEINRLSKSLFSFPIEDKVFQSKFIDYIVTFNLFFALNSLQIQAMSLYTAASILVLICLLPVGTCFWDYDDSHTLSCLNVDSNLSFTEQTQILWNIIILHEFDIYLFLICSPVILLIQLIFIINFLKNRVLLVRPSDIFFVILVSDVFANLHYFSTAMFYVTNSTSDDMPAPFVPFCIINAVVITFVDSVLVCCLFMFFFYIIYALRKNALKQSTFWFKYPPYIVILIVSIAICNVLWFQNFLGLNNTGLCGITMNRRGDFSTLSIPIIQFIMDLVFLILGIYTWVFFKKHMPKTQGLRRRSYQMNASIGIYLFGFTLINFVFTIYDILMFFNCYISSPISELTILASFDNVTRIIQSIFIISFILLNRRFRRKLLKMFRSLFQKKQKLQKTKSIELEHFFTNEFDLGMDDRIIELIQQQNKIDLFKIAQIITVVSGVKISQKQYMKQLTLSPLKKIYFCQTITFKIGTKILNDYDAQSQFLPSVGMLDGTITLHCPRVFKRFLANDNLINVEKSFDLLKNYQKMYNLVEGQGGKSGQFFFFTYDNRYVLKTVTKYQFEFLLSHIQHFARHFQDNPNSILAKIYGLYTIASDQFDKKIHLILMKNLIGRPKQRILRTYDIKGSKYDRQVIKPQRYYKFNEIRKLTLKDTDFMKLQGKLLIDPALVKPLRQIVKQDTLFLKSLNLIDYSLLVVKLYDPADNQLQQQQFPVQQTKRVTSNTDSISNKQLMESILQMIKETIRLNQSHQQESSLEKLEAQPAKLFHKFQRMHSTDAPYQYYHIGIIDYMQKWDLQKKGEKWWKTLSGKKDVSAQQPNVYQKRFVNFIQQITMIDNASIFSEDENFEGQKSLSTANHGQQLKQNSIKDELISWAKSDKD